MKISQMTTDQAADCMVKMAQPVANIMDDEKLQPMLEGLAASKEKAPIKVISSMLPKIVSLCMEDHRRDVYEIVGALAGKPADEISRMKFLWTLKELRDSLDKDFIDFLGSSGTAIAKAGKE